MTDEIRIYILAITYFIQQSFTDWEGAKECARFIVRDGWKK